MIERSEPADRLAILDDIRIATPCEANWDDMAGDDRVRFCALCSRSVYNTRDRTAAEIVELIANREGRLCARLYRRADGTLITADCPATEADGPVAGYGRLRRLGIVLVALVLVWLGRASGDASTEVAAGTPVTWNDWVHWAAVTLKVKSAPVPAPPFVTMGDVY